MKPLEIAPVLQLKTYGTARFLLAFLFCLTATLSGCSSLLPPAAPLPALHAPGLVRLDAFTRLAETTHHYWVNSLLAYQPVPGASDTRLLILQDTSLYDTALDESGEIRTIHAPRCYDLGAIDPKSGQVLCTNLEGIIAFRPDTISTTWPGRLLVSADSFQDHYVRPTWAADGQLFAVLHIKQSENDVDIFAVEGNGGQVRQIATLVAPIPSINWLSWSPDGKWLAFAGGMRRGSFSTTYGLPITSLLQHVPPAPHAPLEITVHSDQLVTLADRPIFGQAWRPGTNDLIYVDGRSLTKLNVTTGKHQALLTVPDGNFCALIWTPDGNRLIFAHCRPVPSDVTPPPEQVYLYTLP